MADNTEGSFEEYKKYLEDSLGIVDVQAPPHPPTAYLLFNFERTCQEKSKSETSLIDLSRTLGQEWKNLPAKKKEYYYKVHDIRQKEKEELQEQYEILSKKKKVQTGYVKYYKQRFKQLSKENPKLDNKEIGIMATNDWKNLSQIQKDKFNKEAAQQNAHKELSSDERQQRVELYNEKRKRFEEALKEDKLKMMKKYGLDNLKEKRKLERQKVRNEKIIQKEIEKVKKEEERKQKREEERKNKLKEKEDEKKKKQEEKEKQKELMKEKKAAEKEKRRESKSKSKPKSESRVKKEAKKPKTPKKTKMIKKATKKVNTKKSAVKAQAKVKKQVKEPKQKAKAGNAVRKVQTRKRGRK